VFAWLGFEIELLPPVHAYRIPVAGTVQLAVRATVPPLDGSKAGVAVAVQPAGAACGGTSIGLLGGSNSVQDCGATLGPGGDQQALTRYVYCCAVEVVLAGTVFVRFAPDARGKPFRVHWYVIPVAGNAHWAFNVTLPPFDVSGLGLGMAFAVHRVGVPLATVTVAFAWGAGPAVLEAITEKVEVAVTLTVWLDVTVVGATPGPVHE
jgi:hypothetical protein